MKTRAFRFWQAICLSGLLGISSLYAQNSEADYVPAPENLQARKEFQDSKFGIFLHWGIYSMFGQGEAQSETLGDCVKILIFAS